MTLDEKFLKLVQDDSWFQEHPVAWEILVDGKQQIASNKSVDHNLQCLLSNMFEYGKQHWTYPPLAPECNAEKTLTRELTVTDCKSLAFIFGIITGKLGYEATTRQIERDGHRFVTKPGIVTFEGKTGDQSLDGRWCFGDHWIVECQGLCYDPTFKFMGYRLDDFDKVYLGWYTEEVKDKNVFTGTYWKADPQVPGSRDVYMRQVPNVAYTFKRTDKNGKEL